MTFSTRMPIHLPKIFPKRYAVAHSSHPSTVQVSTSRNVALISPVMNIRKTPLIADFLGPQAPSLISTSQRSCDDGVPVTTSPLSPQNPIRKSTRLHPLPPLVIDPSHLLLRHGHRWALPLRQSPILLTPPILIIWICFPRTLSRRRRMTIAHADILISRCIIPPRPPALTHSPNTPGVHLGVLGRRGTARLAGGRHVAMRLAASAAPVARLAETSVALQLGDAGGVVPLEFGEAGVVEGFLFGALGAGLFDGFVGEDAGGKEDGCHWGMGGSEWLARLGVWEGRGRWGFGVMNMFCDGYFQFGNRTRDGYLFSWCAVCLWCQYYSYSVSRMEAETDDGRKANGLGTTAPETSG